MISKISTDNFSNESFKFGSAKSIEISGLDVWAQRLSYVGELGYELYVKSSEAINLYNVLIKEGKNFELSHCGMHAMDIMRMESGYLHWGHDISAEENQYQAGLSYAISYKKNIDFVGRNALSKIKDKPISKQFIMLTLKENKPGEPLLLHEEPIYLDNKIIGSTTSGNYSFCYNKNLTFGYVDGNITKETLKNSIIYVEVAKKKYAAELQIKSLNQNNFKTI